MNYKNKVEDYVEAEAERGHTVSMDPIVHFEIPVDDLARAKEFYSLFGWKLEDWPMPDGSTYVGAHTTPVDEKTRQPLKSGAINGGIMLRTKEAQSPIFAIHVNSIDDYVKKIEKAGGAVVKPKA